MHRPARTAQSIINNAISQLLGTTLVAWSFSSAPQKTFGRLYDSKNEGDDRLERTERHVRTVTQDEAMLVTALIFCGESSVFLAEGL